MMHLFPFINTPINKHAHTAFVRKSRQHSVICQKRRERSTGAGRGSEVNSKKKQPSIMPIVCTVCLKGFLLDMLVANSNGAQRQGDYICRDIYSYLSGRERGKSRTSSNGCVSQGCIWNELEAHLMKAKNTRVRKTVESLVHGNLVLSPIPQQDDEQTWNASDSGYATEPVDWKWQTNSGGPGCDTGSPLRNSQPWYNRYGHGSPLSPSYGGPLELVRQDAFIKTTEPMESMTFPDLTHVTEQSGSMDMLGKRPRSLTTFMGGCNSPCLSDSWIGMLPELPPKVDSLIGCHEESSSPPTSTPAVGTNGTFSENLSFELSSEDSPPSSDIELWTE